MSDTRGQVVNVRGTLKYDTGTHYTEVTCKHRAAGACGDCYARLFFALLAIEQQPKNASEVVSRTFKEMKADKA